MIFISLVGFTGYNLGSAFGFERINAGTGSLIIGTQPLLIALIGIFAARERLTPAVVVGQNVIAPATVDELCEVMIADSFGRPPLKSFETIALIERLRARSRELALQHAAPRPLMQGRHLLALGLTPGPQFKPLLDEAFEAQLDGVFADETGGLKWLRKKLPTAPPA